MPVSARCARPSRCAEPTPGYGAPHGRGAAVRHPGRAVPRRAGRRARRARPGRGRRRAGRRAARLDGAAGRRRARPPTGRARKRACARAVHDRRDAVERCATQRDPRRVRAGNLAVLSIHSATDSCYGWDEYGALVGARFDGHPWTQTFTADVLDATHPACAHLGAEWQWHDEVYQFRDLRPDARVLLRVRDGELDLGAAGARPPAFGYPLAWCFAEGDGPRCSRPASGTSRPRGRRPRTCATSRAGSPGRSTRDAPSATSPTGRTGACTSRPWSRPTRARSTTRAVRAVAHARPAPASSICSVRTRSPSRWMSRSRSPSTADRTAASASSSTPRRRWRCPRICSCRTIATRPDRQCSRSTATDRARRCCAAIDAGGRGRRLRAPTRGVGTSCSRPTCAASVNAADVEPGGQVPLRLEPRVRDDGRRRAARRATSGTCGCSLDVLAEHPLVDPARIAAAGLSYGGTCTLFLAAIDDRVARPRSCPAISRRGRPPTPSRGTCAARRCCPGQLGAIEHLDVAALVRAPAAARRDGNRGSDLPRRRGAARRSAPLRRALRAGSARRGCPGPRRVRGRPPVVRRRGRGAS